MLNLLQKYNYLSHEIFLVPWKNIGQTCIELKCWLSDNRDTFDRLSKLIAHVKLSLLSVMVKLQQKTLHFDNVNCGTCDTCGFHSIFLHRTTLGDQLIHILSLCASWERENFVKMYIYATKHNANTYNKLINSIRRLCFHFGLTTKR